MKKIIISLIMTVVCMINIQAQKYFTKTGEIVFYSSTPIEDIEAVSNSASSVYDAETGKIQWAVLIKSFEFEKALMQEHFNENYMESSKYPKATFKGKIEDFDNLDLSKDGNYTVKVVGDLDIHGVSQSVKTMANFSIEDGVAHAVSNLKVAVSDFKIEIPSVVNENIAKEIDIKIKAHYELLNK